MTAHHAAVVYSWLLPWLMQLEALLKASFAQALEARNLITQQNISVKAADTVNRINTNILHLPRFKLNVVPGMIKVRHILPRAALSKPPQ